MSPRVLLIVAGDPRRSARPAEAIRIAAGVGAWKKADITLYLHGAAALVLSEYADELLDEENYTRYLPILRDLERAVFVDAGNRFVPELGEPVLAFRAMDDDALARLAGESEYVMTF